MLALYVEKKTQKHVVIATIYRTAQKTVKKWTGKTIKSNADEP